MFGGGFSRAFGIEIKVLSWCRGLLVGESGTNLGSRNSRGIPVVAQKGQEWQQNLLLRDDDPIGSW